MLSSHLGFAPMAILGRGVLTKGTRFGTVWPETLGRCFPTSPSQKSSGGVGPSRSGRHGPHCGARFVARHDILSWRPTSDMTLSHVVRGPLLRFDSPQLAPSKRRKRR